MAIKQFTIGVSKTINLGNFQSYRVEASVTVDLDPNLTNRQQMDTAQQELRNLLEATYKAQRKTATEGA